MSVYITVNRSEIEKFHAAGIREIAIRDGKEYVFKAEDVQGSKVQSSMTGSDLEPGTLNIEPSETRGEKDNAEDR
jgi:hypothetical protein